jgi:PqqD family protein of HPr-rel-A system
LSQHALRELAISDSGFVFDPRSGATFTLNATGLAIVLALRDGLPIDALATRVRERFAETPESLDDDVMDFVRALEHHGILPPAGRPAGEARR